MTHSISRIALAGALVFGASPAFAQDGDAMQKELAEMRAAMAQMSARIAALEAELAETEAQATMAAEQAADATQTARTAIERTDAATGIAFKGAPEISSDGGWSFKPRGRLQFDAGTISAPESTGREDGFGSEVRRARLGVSGDIPGGFGYKFEVDVAGSDLAVADAIVTYETDAAAVQVGQFNNFQSLEELTSSLHTSFIERAAFTDAFGFERRLGAGVIVTSGDLLLQGGVFSDNMDDLSNKNWSVDTRAVFMPRMGDTQLHFGGSVHYADLEAGSSVRYRQRPLVHFTSERFINTGNLDAESEFGVGLEAAVIAGRFHAAAETFWQKVDMPTMADSPTFFGGYVEAGFFLTAGDSRGYKKGTFDRVKPVNPVDEGGMGSVQFNIRYDRLDLNDAGVIGGRQDGYMASLIWKPTDYTALLANYGRLEYSDAVFALASGSRDYGVDAFALRAQIDF